MLWTAPGMIKCQLHNLIPAHAPLADGSNVKILKTSGITPMPNYDGITVVELKRELARFGLKPMRRKRAVAMLKKIYTEVHPVYQIPDDFIDLGDKTLNEPRDEPIEESVIDDTRILPKAINLIDLVGTTDVFLKWLRQSDNDDLHNHLLSLQPALIDELHQRMSRADTAVCVIPKKALANILDRLGVTFSMGFTFGRQKARK
ncbi:hypothetical protein GCK32_015953 [Trichostrongylus colubriformis]|uniref:Uncharacterized protein n=1 Tax=Trichostrongylus colubriformis TaxID=6319 RepID=A0AAN8FRR3_TRICO